MLRSTPLSRLIVRHSCERARGSPPVPPPPAYLGNHCRSTCPALPLTRSYSSPQRSVPCIAIPVWKYEYVSSWPKQMILPSHVSAPTGTGARVGVTVKSSSIG